MSLGGGDLDSRIAGPSGHSAGCFSGPDSGDPAMVEQAMLVGDRKASLRAAQRGSQRCNATDNSDEDQRRHGGTNCNISRSVNSRAVRLSGL